MANGGQFDGKSLMSEETFNEIHSEPTKDCLGRKGVIHYFTKGGFAKFADIKDTPET